MEEAFLHYTWKFQKFSQDLLQTSDGSLITILNQGFHNHDAGPDFQNARIRIGDLEWAGQVEIHVRSSDWNKHQHHTDPNYENVILHVVYEEDGKILINGKEIPTLVLKDRIDPELLSNYNDLKHNIRDIPCSDQLNKVSSFKINTMIARMISERLEQKADTVVAPLLSLNKNNWEEVAYILLARALGMKVNTDSFEILTKSLPSNILKKHQHQPLQIEALIFGMAGFLDDHVQDDYHEKLQKEFRFLNGKYGLDQKLSRYQWKYARLRPNNLPTIRLSQLCAIMASQSNLMTSISSIGDLKELEKLLTAPVSDYWQKHYDFSKASKTSAKLGKMAISNIIINAIAPLLVSYGRHAGEIQLVEKAISLLEGLPEENNKITRKWSALGLKQNSAFDSQGLIQLFQSYCSRNRCLSCEIGTAIISR